MRVLGGGVPADNDNVLVAITTALRTVERVRAWNASGMLRRRDVASARCLLAEAYTTLLRGMRESRCGDDADALAYHVREAAEALATAVEMDVDARSDAEFAIDVDVYTGSAATELRRALLVGAEPAGSA